ncbi:hypothetical protein WJX73_004816 [Symbiochloris irregularis]|uniref:KANL3/Tex30 alpha/beta hydrolase-like domain-containing protein n=1 Tax=Symbiochloris irregularis TaxID=706552 RepID=A0AAW1NYC6_9CHLO
MAPSSVPLEGKAPVAISVSGDCSTSVPLAVLLTHGAGGDMNSGNLPAYAGAFSKSGIPCVRMNHPRNIPGGQKAMQAVMNFKGKGFPVTQNWVLSGQSMGCRIAAEVAHAEASTVKGLLFFSYPLHPPGKLDQLRDVPLQRLKQPILFVRGTRDTFSEAEQFEALLPTIPSDSVKVHTVEG